MAISTRSTAMTVPSSRVASSPSPASSSRSSERPATRETPASASHAAMRPPTCGPSRAAWGASSGVTIDTAAPRSASETAASQPMKPEPTTMTRAPGGAAVARRALSRTVRTTCTRAESAPAIGGRTGSEPVHRTQSP